MTHYIYDASGERVLKGSSDIETLHENGSPANGGVVFNAYKTYPSAFIVVDGNGQYSKHYYAGSERVVSRIGDQNSDIFNLQTVLGARQGFDPKALQQLQVNDLKTLADSAKIGKVAFKEPKAEKANEASRAPEPGNIYFFHPDHLGTATYLTDINGNPYQFFLNLPFGETMAEQHSLSEDYENPFKFNGKELDEETGLYYYGARYYDPRISIWLGVDPMAEQGPEYSPYCYTFNNPINMVDPDGRWPLPTGTGLGWSISRAAEVMRRVGRGESWSSAYYNTYKSDVKNVIRYATPLEDVYGVYAGKDFDNNKYNRASAAAWAVVSFVPFSKAGKLLKFSDEVSGIVKASGRVVDDAGKEGKEIITILHKGSETFNNGVKVAEDIVGNLGDDAVEKLGKFGSQKGQVVGHMSKDGKRGWRVDFDKTKGGHINWWTANEKGAILIKAGQNQVDQIIKNDIPKLNK